MIRINDLTNENIGAVDCIAFDELVPGEPNPCLHGGTCRADEYVRWGFSCKCKPGYVGPECQWGKSYILLYNPVELLDDSKSNV